MQHSNFFDHEGMVLTMFYISHIKFYKLCKVVANREDLNSNNWYMSEYVFSIIKNSSISIDLEYVALHFLHCKPHRSHFVCRNPFEEISMNDGGVIPTIKSILLHYLSNESDSFFFQDIVCYLITQYW